MKVSIITPVLNNREHIENCVRSVTGQEHPDIEYIVMDGGSTDGTIDIIKKYESKKLCLVSKKDNGMYYALNDGLKLASGEIIGILNSDDVYADISAISDVVKAMEANGASTSYGDLVYVNRRQPDKVIRFWKAGEFKRERFLSGWMPPHPAFFARKNTYEKHGYFNTDFSIAADYELMLRFLYKFKESACYIPRVLVRMRTGGVSNKNIENIIKKSSEDYKAWKVNGLKATPFTILLKNVLKIPQFVIK